MNEYILTPGQLTYADIRNLFHTPTAIKLNPNAKPAIEASRAFLREQQALGGVIYGVNTGFGKLANQIIPSDQLEQLQKNLLYSHAAGIGENLTADVVAMVLLFKANSLARGYSAVRFEIIERLLQFYNAHCYPCIPSQGSVGASGDLAPLAHLALALLGEWPCLNEASLNLPPLILQAKEGLALINGLQVSTAVAMKALIAAEQTIEWSMVAGALSMEALNASVNPLHPAIHACRDLPAQAYIANHLQQWLDGSEYVTTTHPKRVQDPYSIRCQPQVLGAIYHAFLQAQRVIVAEANAVSDNPLVFAEQQCIMSGGNFHGEALSMAADQLAIAISEMSAISERRIALLIDPHMSDLPAFLAKDPGLQSGLMIAHVTASALACENKTLATPVSIESLPTSANQEDHVSHAGWATRRLLKMIENLQSILAIEIRAALQGIELQLPKQHGTQLIPIIAALKQEVPFFAEDHPIHDDIVKVKWFLQQHPL